MDIDTPDRRLDILVLGHMAELETGPPVCAVIGDALRQLLREE